MFKHLNIKKNEGFQPLARRRGIKVLKLFIHAQRRWVFILNLFARSEMPNKFVISLASLTNKKGMSVIELLVVIAIIAVFSAIVFMNPGSSQLGLDRAARQVASDLRRAQNMAMSVKEHKDKVPCGYGIYFDGVDRKSYTLFADHIDSCNDIYDSGEEVDSIALPSGTQIDGAAFTVFFETPFGATTIFSDPFDITISSAGGTKKININSVGKIDIVDSGGGGTYSQTEENNCITKGCTNTVNFSCSGAQCTPTSDGTLTIYLKGDYDSAFSGNLEYATIYTDNINIGTAGGFGRDGTCGADHCASYGTKTFTISKAELTNYLADTNLEIKFVDRSVVNFCCNAYHKAMLEFDY